MRFLKRYSIFRFFIIFAFCFYGSYATCEPLSDLRSRIKTEGELTPFPEAQELLIKIAQVIDSVPLKSAIAKSRTLQLMRENVRTSLFHINLKFELPKEAYPYDPPFKEPFPFRPTLEAIDEASRFLDVVNAVVGFDTEVRSEIEQFPYFKELELLFPASKIQEEVVAISKKDMAMNPVDSYIAFQDRLKKYGENASFTEFSDTVNGLLEELLSPSMREFRKSDIAFGVAAGKSIVELRELRSKKGGAKTRLYGKYVNPFPYRKTIQALDRAIAIVDIRDRLKYPLGINWHDVELSWFIGDTPKVLPLYHVNRYKYQMAGLLADPEMVLMPNWGGASFEYLARIRVAPIGVIEYATHTDRIDRHHNTPRDNNYHDVNHARRTWGYDKRKLQERGAVTFEQKIEVYREQDVFMKKLLNDTNPKAVSKENLLEVNLRKHEVVLIFETLHETARTPDRESLIYDLLRDPATPQPFEVQMQAAVEDLEDMRAFDGNLRSGADQLALNLKNPTIIRYFYDRAPGFLANVDNKQRWGFYDSIFNMKRYMPAPDFRTPRMVADAAIRLFARLGYENPPDVHTLVKQTIDHSGQPELWNYFGMADMPIVRFSGLDLLNVAAASEIQATWRRNSLYEDRWKPTDAKLLDGTIVNDDWSMQEYLKEREIPEYLWQYYRLGKDPATGETILEEDLRNLPNEYLAKNHQGENLMSGAKAVAVVDRLWHKDLNFKNLDSAERWLVSAAQTVHQAVLDRNSNGARYNKSYNVHWLLLPAVNQINDLELIRVGFEARMKKGVKKISPQTAMMVQEAMSRLYRKIRKDLPIRSCRFLLSKQRMQNLANNHEIQ